MSVTESHQSLFQPYLDSVYVSSHSQRTVLVYANGLRHLEKFAMQNYHIDLSSVLSNAKNGQIDIYKMLREFVVYLDKSGKKPSTIKTVIASVKGFFRYYGVRIYSEDFKHMIRMPKQIHYNEEPMTKDVLLRLLRNVSPKLQTIILVAVSSGMRIGEIAQLRISDIDFGSSPVKVRIRAEIAKGRQSRETFITKEAAKSLQDYIKKTFSFSNEAINGQNYTLIFGRNDSNEGYQKKTVDNWIASLKYSIRSIPELMKFNENGRHAIHFHAFRKYFRTVVGNAVGRDFAEALMGHRFYLDTYYQLPEDKKREMYLKVEPSLTLSDYTDIEKKIQENMALYNDVEIFVRKILKESLPLDSRVRNLVLNEKK